MTKIVLLDSGPLGMVTNPRATDQTKEAREWLRKLLLLGIDVVVPEIADYEVRRELIRAQKARSVNRLDELERALDYLPLTTNVMRAAAQFWARARQSGSPTAADAALDGDVILAAQAAVLAEELPEDEVVIATTNVGHLDRFVAARLWREIGAEE